MSGEQQSTREKKEKIVVHMLKHAYARWVCAVDLKMRWIFTYYIVFIAMHENSSRLPFYARARSRPTKACALQIERNSIQMFKRERKKM